MELSLPKKEETTITVKAGGETVTFDYFDWETVVMDVHKQLKSKGASDDRKAYMDLLADGLNQAFGLDLGRSALIALMSKMNDFGDGLKKKFSDMYELSDSTESIRSESSEKKKKKKSSDT
jgi:hypothetical protein